MRSFLQRNPGFGRLWAAAAVSQVGDWLSFVAVAMLAMHQGRDAFGLATGYAAHALPGAVRYRMRRSSASALGLAGLAAAACVRFASNEERETSCVVPP